MSWKSTRKRSAGLRWCFVFFALSLGVLFFHSHAQAFTFTVNVVDEDGSPVNAFRWLVEEDNTFEVNPEDPVQTDPDTGYITNIKLSNHKSYAPVVKKGRTTGSSVTINVPNGKRYAVSVLPIEGYSVGFVKVTKPGDYMAIVHSNPLPTAQISVLVFHDHRPVNNAPDIPAEEGLPGFAIKVYDQFGEMLTDAFGNPLGTTYQQDQDGNYILDPEGSPVVASLGSGIFTDANGEAMIKHLAPGKYGVRAVPRDGRPWIQTATIEGTPGIDAWVRANEPKYMVEFGQAFYHVFIGFTLEKNDLATLPNPTGVTGTITGQIVNIHQSRPPSVEIQKGPPFPEAWIALNTLEAGEKVGVYVAPCNPRNGKFTITDVPPGTYQLVIWDVPLDQIVAFHTVIVPPEGGLVEVNKVPVNAWFGRLEGSVFYDQNANGFRDEGEVGIPEQVINLRFRDGSIYASTATNAAGNYEFLEVFPWFKWIVAEVDFLRYRATGVTVVVDDGGKIPKDGGWAMPSEGKRNPQPQICGQDDVDAGICLALGDDLINPNTGNNYSRTETGPVLTQAMILYADQNHQIDWGKRAYGAGRNGGISGIVFYDITRAEDDPRFNVGDPWQPAIPRVQVNLYKDFDENGVIDDLDGDGKVTPADVDNHPFGWAEGGPKGPEDVDHNGNGLFDKGDAFRITTTDSWDDNMPTGCPGPPQKVTIGGVDYSIDPCAETLRTWNQVRPGIFDGGYAFGSVAGGPAIPNGTYIVEVSPPRGYEVVKEEDKNVDFGDSYIPSPQLLPPACVGEDHLVPKFLTLFPRQKIKAPFAGKMRPLCDRKQVEVVSGRNAAADFFLFTQVPKAARIVGLITNDVANTFDVNDPNFAEKLSPSFLPVSFKDYLGNEITRVYSDQFGGYEALLPSTVTANVPNPTGLALGIVTICLNDPGPDPAHPDPHFNPAYGISCYNWNVFPGRISYADTPVLPIGSFMASTVGQVDCEFPAETPRIASVSGPGASGPYVTGTGQQITINSVGKAQILNPNFKSNEPVDPVANPRTVERDFGFGTVQGRVTLGGMDLDVNSWNDSVITATLPPGAATGQLMVIRGDNNVSTEVGVTLTVGGASPVIHVPADYPTIQEAVDAAAPNSLILVAPGIYYENVIMWKRVKLQGWGEGATVINAMNFDLDHEAQWVAKVKNLVDQGEVTLVPGQRNDFLLERGAAITVLAKKGAFTLTNPARIDGFRITGAIIGGGIFVNGHARGLQISNNRLESNKGNFGGGIRVGWPAIVNPNGTGFRRSFNNRVKILHNHIKQNGANSAGAGISIFNGANNYEVSNNYVCGNFSGESGGGLAHIGLSDNGVIRNNKILLNEVFKDLNVGGYGGGVFIAGEVRPGGAEGGSLSLGTGTVTIDSNFIARNLSSNDGGGISILRASGEDVRNNPVNPENWHSINVFNNILVNNVTQFAGGGIAVSETALMFTRNNTIAHNASAASNQETFRIGGKRTNPQVAGVASRPHSQGLINALAAAGIDQNFARPKLVNNIIWENQSLYWDSTADDGLGALLPATPLYRDVGVAGGQGKLNPSYSLLSSATAGLGNISADPFFVDSFPFGELGPGGLVNEIKASGAGGEGLNSVKVLLQPLTVVGDYHIFPGSPAVNTGTANDTVAFPDLAHDFDGEPRPAPAGSVDMGADEVN